MSEDVKHEVGDSAVTVVPPVDICECGDGIKMWVEVPGANAGTVSVEVRNKILEISASSSLKRNGRPVVFKRAFQLTDGADIENITAKTRDGVLNLFIPKSDRAKVHRIQVA